MATADETQAALIDALLRLIRARSLSELSVREIAREAGVNHGMVHRHFGSRDNLIRAATSRVAQEIHEGYPDGTSATAATFRYLRERPELVRVLAQACLDHQTDLLEAASPRPERLCAVVDAARELLDALELPVAPDPAVLHAYAVSSILGWLLFRPLLAAGFGLPDGADEHVEGLLALLDGLVEAR